MSDRWVFVTAFTTLVLVIAGAFVIPQFFVYEVLKSLIYVAIALMVFFGEDKFSYMLGIVVPPVWFILDILMGEFFRDLVVLGNSLMLKPSRPLETPLHGVALITEIVLFFLCLRAWRKQVTEKFFGKTFGICLAVAIVYVAILACWRIFMFPSAG